MRNKLFSTLTLLAAFSLNAEAAEQSMIGVVNFTNCVMDSKAGKREQENMDNLRKQMASMMENVEKELREITAKFDDTEYLDSLSPKAEEELKAKHQALQEDLARYQQQFYQVLNHAQYQMVQKLSNTIASASEKVANIQGFEYVINREACFYIRSDRDVTNLVITEMDKAFDLENSKKGNLSGNDEDSLSAIDELTLDQAG